jgi:hypothetical protein
LRPVLRRRRLHAKLSPDELQCSSGWASAGVARRRCHVRLRRGAQGPRAPRTRLVWTFNRAGEFELACLIAGHYQAGMLGRIKVAAAAPRT